MKPKIKVLYIHQDAMLTGSAISLFNLISGLDKNEIEPLVLLPKDGPAKSLFDSLNIKVDIVYYMPFWTTPGPRWYQRNSLLNYKALLSNKPLQNYILKLKPDIIHINDKAALAGGLAAKGTKIPVVQHLRSSYYTTSFKLFKEISVRAIKSYTSYYIAISEDEIDDFYTEKNLSVIYNTIERKTVETAINEREKLRQEFNFTDNDVVVGFVGLFTQLKGAWDFMNMAGILQKALPDQKLKFMMVGTLPSDKVQRKGIKEKLGLEKIIPANVQIQELIQKNNLEENLILTGYRKDALKLMAAMDIMVVCTQLGVLGRQPFESMSVKTPVVVSAGHSNKSTIVKNNVTGFVVPPKSPAKLADAVKKLILNPELRKKMGNAGYEYAKQNFDPVKNSAKIAEIYKMLLTK